MNLFDNNNYAECLCAELENVKFGKHFCAFFFFPIFPGGCFQTMLKLGEYRLWL